MRGCCVARRLPSFGPDGDTFHDVRSKLANQELKTEDGSAALALVRQIRCSLGPQPIQEAARLLLCFVLDSVKKYGGEAMKHWTRRCTLARVQVGEALNTASRTNNTLSHETLGGETLD